MVLVKAVADGSFDNASVHGVLVRAFDSGVLIAGRSGIGKSSCALELVDRGHKLVADDVVNIERRGDFLIGNAPAALFGSLEVRGLGIVDVRRMFSEAAALDRCEINLCIEFTDSSDEYADRAESGVHSFSLLGVEVPRISFVVNGSQSLRVLVETAVRYITRDGETGSREFVGRYNASLIDTVGK
jgi:HPr kinase/phosphorylase